MSKHHEFPKMMYKKGAEPVTVHSQKDQDDLGKGWTDKPVAIKADRGDAIQLNGGRYVKSADNEMEKRVAKLEAQMAALIGEPDEVAEEQPTEEGYSTEEFGADQEKGTNAAEGIQK